MLHEPDTNSILLIDNGEFATSQKAVEKLQEKLETQAQPEFLFSTHHHYDVWADNATWKKKNPGIEVVTGSLGPKQAPEATIQLKNLDKISIGKFPAN